MSSKPSRHDLLRGRPTSQTWDGFEGVENQMQHSLSLSVAQTGATTMSSREIAELTDKRHDNVMRDIRSMLSEIGEDPLKFEETDFNIPTRLLTCH